jgi:acetolactate synthase small subunit
VLKTITAYGARVKDIGHLTLTVELTGESSIIDSFIADITIHFAIAELSRSGMTALESGDKYITNDLTLCGRNTYEACHYS